MTLPVHGETKAQHDLIARANRHLESAKDLLKELKRSQPANRDEMLLPALKSAIKRIKKARVSAENLATVWTNRVERTTD
jgi:predicted Rossmann fold nucleotide-binding protein DprA/Smf involved in DNA uptake